MTVIQQAAKALHNREFSYEDSLKVINDYGIQHCRQIDPDILAKEILSLHGKPIKAQEVVVETPVMEEQPKMSEFERKVEETKPVVNEQTHKYVPEENHSVKETVEREKKRKK